MMSKEEFVTILKQRDIQVTPQRLAIIEQLKLRKDHPSAEMIFNELKGDYPSLTLVTVYNTLQKLESQGLCHKINPLHSSARYDGNIAEHHHVICNNCHTIVDVHDASISIEPPEWMYKEFKVLNHSINFYGLCVVCQESIS
jgi:Fur family peroxide stress response transcriptional regulator